MFGIPFTRESLELTKYVLAWVNKHLAATKGVFEKVLLIFFLFNKNVLLTMILSSLAGTEWKDYTSMLILGDETALITELFIAGFILWLVNIHRYTPLLPILSAPSGTGRNCHSLSDYIMIAKAFHATRPFIRIEILRQECQVFSSNLTISNYNFEFIC